MTLLAPWFLAGGLLTAVGLVLVHLLALQRPPAAPLPTARFIPDAPARAASRADRPTDRWLLLVRVLAVLCVALAFARPVRDVDRAAVRQVLVIDRSRGVLSESELRARAAALYRPGDAVIVADSTARALAAPLADSLAALAVVNAPGNVGAALAAAFRTATALRDSTDSVRVVLVSPLAAESIDAATAAVRGAWPAAIRVERVAARADSVRAHDVTVRGDDDDPLAVAVAFLAARPAAVPTRIVRGAPDGADSAWARDGNLLVVWPADAAPAAWRARAVADTMGGATTDDATDAATVVATLVRTADAPAASPAGWRVVARWVDGAPASLEHALGAGCVREVGVPVARGGDLVLRAAFHDFVRAHLAPCGGRTALAPPPDSALAWLAGTGVPTLALADVAPTESPFVPWLLGAAIVLLLAELFVRARRSDA